jgi:hypothetical protein
MPISRNNAFASEAPEIEKVAHETIMRQNNPALFFGGGSFANCTHHPALRMPAAFQGLIPSSAIPPALAIPITV